MSITTDVSFSFISAQHIAWRKCIIKTDGVPYSSLTLRLHSPATFQLGDQTLLSNPQNITYVPAGTPYEANYPMDGEILFVHFVEKTPFWDGVQNFVPLQFNDIHALFSKIARIYATKPANYYLEASSLLLRIAVYLTRLQSKTFENRNIETALHIMRDEFTNSKLSICEICSRANVSESYFRKVFHQEFGISPIRYLNELRIDHAQRMLYQSHCTVEHAALESGFSDYRYFARVTKKLRSCTPSDLRNI